MEKTAGRTKGVARFAGTLIKATLLFGILMVAAAGLWLMAGNVNGPLRMVLSGLMAAGVAWFGVGFFLQMGSPPPPDPEPVKVDPRLRLNYVCSMCGLELAVVMAAKEKAPRHCGEAMELVRRPAGPEGQT
ncbi:MAG: hypothetical protein ACRDIU_05225 [Actinomycetota bacterium]